MNNNRHSEQGSAIIWILIAVGLFAALNFAFNSSSRTSTSVLDDAEASAYANQIIAYGNEVKAAVKRLTLRGCSDTEISFENNVNPNYVNPNAPTNKSCHVFDVAGGGLTWKDEKTAVYNGYYILGNANIDSVGTTENELILYGEPPLETCKYINKISGGPEEPEVEHIGNAAYTAPFDGSKFKGNYAGADLAAEPASGTTWRSSKKIACTLRTGFIAHPSILAPPEKAYQFYYAILVR